MRSEIGRGRGKVRRRVEYEKAYAQLAVETLDKG